MKSENKRSVIVGIFVFIGIAILVTGVLTLGGQQKKFIQTVHLRAIFDDIGGLQVGNNVWFSGVKIGTVRKINFHGDAQVEVELNVDKKVIDFIRKDSKATLSSDGLIGNKIIVIFGGSTSAPVVEEGDLLVSVMPLDTDKMMETLQVNNANLVQITNDLKVLTSKLAAGEGIVGAVMTDSVLAENFRVMISNLHQASLSSVSMLNDLNIFTAKINQNGNLFNELATDTQMVGELRETMESLKNTAKNSQELTHKLSNIADKFDAEDNAIGMLLNDQVFASELKSAMINADSATFNLNRGMKALEFTWPFNRGFKRQAKAKKENQN